MNKLTKEQIDEIIEKVADSDFPDLIRMCDTITLRTALESLGEEEVAITIIGNWQKCPKCNGQGTVSRPPKLAGDVETWSGNQTQFDCNVCDGEMIISTANGLPPSKNAPINLTP